MNPLRMIHGWTLLTSPADYDAWHGNMGAEIADAPASFPCFVLAAPTLNGGYEYEYLYSQQLGDMQDALALVAGAAV